MAARDGDRPMWPAKHSLQIPLFIHKLDPLGPRRWVFHLVDLTDVCVCGWWRERIVNLGKTLCAGRLVPHYLLKIRSLWECAFVCLCVLGSEHTHSYWQTESTVLLSGNE